MEIVVVENIDRDVDVGHGSLPCNILTAGFGRQTCN